MTCEKLYVIDGRFNVRSLLLSQEHPPLWQGGSWLCYTLSLTRLKGDHLCYLSNSADMLRAGMGGNLADHIKPGSHRDSVSSLNAAEHFQ